MNLNTKLKRAGYRFSFLKVSTFCMNVKLNLYQAPWVDNLYGFTGSALVDDLTCYKLSVTRANVANELASMQSPQQDGRTEQTSQVQRAAPNQRRPPYNLNHCPQDEQILRNSNFTHLKGVLHPENLLIFFLV